MQNKKVLVVDDEMDMRIFISTLLETSGYKAIIATNGEEGIEQARKHKPAAIILDVLMPKSGGVQMYREVKTDEDLKDIPVIMISIVDKKALGYRLGAADYLVKPLPEGAVRGFKIFGFIARTIGLTLIGLIVYAMLFGYR